MSSPSDVRLSPRASDMAADIVDTFRAMASVVTVQLPGGTPGAVALIDAVRRTFAEVERSCTRFDEGSDLMRANRTRTRTVVGTACVRAVAAAHAAYRETGGLFDPRVLPALRAIGYDRSFAFEAAPVSTPARTGDPAAEATHGVAWEARWDEARSTVAVGDIPIDLGGIGKGLALRWAAEQLVGQVDWFLIEAGGDCTLGGRSPAGNGWSVGVEDPLGGDLPVAVLAVSDAAVATTSTRLRRWRAGTEQVHHILDPRTGRPAVAGALAVTVCAPDPATAEVWSKSLLIAGAGQIHPLAERHGLAALWIDDAGGVHASEPMRDLMRWRRT